MMLLIAGKQRHNWVPHDLGAIVLERKESIVEKRLPFMTRSYEQAIWQSKTLAGESEQSIEEDHWQPLGLKPCIEGVHVYETLMQLLSIRRWHWSVSMGNEDSLINDYSQYCDRKCKWICRFPDRANRRSLCYLDSFQTAFGD